MSFKIRRICSHFKLNSLNLPLELPNLSMYIHIPVILPRNYYQWRCHTSQKISIALNLYHCCNENCLSIKMWLYWEHLEKTVILILDLARCRSPFFIIIQISCHFIEFCNVQMECMYARIKGGRKLLHLQNAWVGEIKTKEWNFITCES